MAFFGDTDDDFIPGDLVEEDDDFVPPPFDEPPVELPSSPATPAAKDGPATPVTSPTRRRFISPAAAPTPGSSSTTASPLGVRLPLAADTEPHAPVKRRRIWGKTAMAEESGAELVGTEAALATCADLWRTLLEALRGEEESEAALAQRLAKGNHEEGRKKVEYFFSQKLRDEKDDVVMSAPSKADGRKRAREKFAKLAPAAQLEFVLKAAVKRGDALKAVLVGVRAQSRFLDGGAGHGQGAPERAAVV